MTMHPPAKAIANGHRLEYDPPHALSSALRWTCTECCATALSYRGNEYGSAVTDMCTVPGARALAQQHERKEREL